MRLEDELLADAKGVVDKEGWLRKELKDLAPTDSQGVEAVNFDQRARESFSSTFFLSQHEKRLAQQEQQEDVTRHAVDDLLPMLPPPPPRQTPVGAFDVPSNSLIRSSLTRFPVPAGRFAARAARDHAATAPTEQAAASG
eukprot:27531-Eustigmatos_ZCMA.PRE.1